MKHCYRGRGRFRLRSILERCVPIGEENDETIYSASSDPVIGIDQLVYFCSSVVWRASIRDWYSSGKRYEAICLGNTYREQIRGYLLGELQFPERATVLVVVSRLKFPHLAFNFPEAARLESCYSHTLHISGITFQLRLGKQMPQSAYETCVLRSPAHPIFVSNAGDARVQRSVLRLMGKVDTPWGSYPLIEGFEGKELKK